MKICSWSFKLNPTVHLCRDLKMTAPTLRGSARRNSKRTWNPGGKTSWLLLNIGCKEQMLICYLRTVKSYVSLFFKTALVAVCINNENISKWTDFRRLKYEYFLNYHDLWNVVFYLLIKAVNVLKAAMLPKKIWYNIHIKRWKKGRVVTLNSIFECESNVTPNNALQLTNSLE